MADTGELELLGRGRRRAAYRLAGTGQCLKCYLPDALVEDSGIIAKEIRKCRFDRKRNTCAAEYDCFQELKARLPARLLAVFPEKIELVADDKRGWCLVESEVCNHDGSSPKGFAEVYWQSGGDRRRELLARFKDLMLDLAKYRVRFFDPPNVLVQTLGPGGEFRLRIVDFEPSSRTLIQLDRLFPVLASLKLKRRVRRFLRLQLGDDGKLA